MNENLTKDGRKFEKGRHVKAIKQLSGEYVYFIQMHIAT